MNENNFKKLAEIDVSDHVENKGKFTYLSWPFAITELCVNYPGSTWEVIRFPLVCADPVPFMVPYLQTPIGYFVEVSVTVEGVTKSQIHPVLNNQNKPIESPNTFDINTSIQRCLVKAIALHGLGLYIYAGEDLPTVREIFSQDQWDAFSLLVEGDDSLAFTAFCQANEQVLDNLIQKHLEPHRENKTVTAEQKRIKELDAAGHVEASKVAESITVFSSDENLEAINEVFDEMGEMEKRLIWIRLDDPTKEHIKQLKEAAQ